MSDAPWDLYAKTMLGPYGFPLWHADPELDGQYGPREIELGSVGYIDKGKFRHLFNAMKDADDPFNVGRVPNSFEPFKPRLLDITAPEPMLRQAYLASRSIRHIDVEVGGNTASPVSDLVSAGGSLSFECKQDTGAVLLLDQPAMGQSIRNTRLIKAFLQAHLNNWHEHATGLDGFGYDLQIHDIKFVSGTLKTTRWACATFSGSYRNKKGSLNVNAAGIGGMNISVSIENHVVPNEFYNNGPISADVVEGSSSSLLSPKRDQCIFFHYFALKKRLFQFLDKIEAGAGPQELPREDPGAKGKLPVLAATGSISQRDIEEHPSIDEIDGTKFDPVATLLDYMLAKTKAEYAIASDRDVLAIFGSIGVPDDIMTGLETINPPIEVDENNVATVNVDMTWLDALEQTWVQTSSLLSEEMGSGNLVERGRGQGRGAPGGGNRGNYRGRGNLSSSGYDSESRQSRSRSPGGNHSGYRGGNRGEYRGDRGRYRGFRGGYHGGFRGGDRGRGRGRGRGGGGVFAPDRSAHIDQRLTDGSQDQLVARLQSLRLRDDDLPVRPGFGTNGQDIKLRMNFFPVTLPKGPFHEYSVHIDPPAKNKRLLRRIFQLAESSNEWKRARMTNRVAHDHSTKLIAPNTLPQPLQIKIVYSDEDEDGEHRDKPREPKEYTMTIKYVQPIDTDAMSRYLNGDPQQRLYDFMPVVNAMNIILSAYPNRVTGGGVMVGRNKFFHPSPAAPPVPLGGGLEAWRGFYSSVRPSWKQLMVNVNVCTTAFYTPGNLAERLIEFMNLSPSARAETFVRGLRVKTTHHLGYRKTVKNVAKVNARQHKFNAEGMGEVTVEQYFLRKYKIKLRYPELPLIDVGEQDTNLLPAEVCIIIESQPFEGGVSDELIANMLALACQTPNINGEAITVRGMHELGLAQSPPPANAFGITVGSEMAVVPGRILPPPVVRYASGTVAVDDRASWNLRGVRFAIGARLQNWAVLLIQDGNGRDEFRGKDDPELANVWRGFADMCRRSGMNVDSAPPQIELAALPPKRGDDPLRKRAIPVIRGELMKIKPKPKIVLVVLSNGDRHIYSGLKHLCDVYLDVATVCVHAAKIRKEKGQLQYFANVALKFNIKLGGLNHQLAEQNMAWLNKEPTMLVGMAVMPPCSEMMNGTPSVAAVVASIDKHIGQFPASLRIQESRKEMIVDLKSMMEERLLAFRTKNKFLPSRVLVYRDGVSEGQFSIVVAEEMPEIRKAFDRFNTPGNPYRPKLTIVTSDKHHHTRFFPTDLWYAAQDGNPKPGTVVDRGATAVYGYNFYLQAHDGSMETAIPTHYQVVHDEIGFWADQLQGLTNDISYMFACATNAISLAPPAYYANLACERGQCYLHALLQETPDSGSGEDEVMAEAKKLWQFDKDPNAVGGALKDTMFYV